MRAEDVPPLMYLHAANLNYSTTPAAIIVRTNLASAATTYTVTLTTVSKTTISPTTASFTVLFKLLI